MSVEPGPDAGGERLPVTAVICARNRERSIADCISSVAAARPARILVIDGSSTDATAEIALEAGADVVSDQGAGLGAARRLGADLAETPWIAYVDSDARITRSTLAKLLDVADANGFDAVQAELRSSTPHPTYWQRGEIWRRRLQEPPGPASIIGCQATLVRRSVSLEVPFDSTFAGAAEDHDWCFRARAAGAVLAHTDRAIAYHEDRASFREFASQRFWYGRGMARLLIRHRRLAPQVRAASAGTMQTPVYAPFMLTSWIVTAIGMALETVRLTLDPDVRRRLQEGGPSGRPAIPG